ncbi:MAG: ROK family protein [Anaerolineales bacterium]|nr:ROK family protein [Chloroflexota bacterium]MBL6981435.1 ROK family protein [Anaerolineales bacterium]
MTLFGGIEAGGTKFVCAVGTGPDDIRTETRFPTTTPDETLQQAIAFFRAHGELASIGIGSFGPVDPNPESPTFGYITSTPKPGWAHTNFVGAISTEFDIPIGFDTDVNAAALGEHRWGAAQGLETFIYLTVGTGIGGGAMVEGNLLHGVMHPEMGHTLLPHDQERDPFKGICPFHGNCLEGLASGPALEARWGARAETLPDDHPAWDLEATYLAYALVNYILIIAPQRLILGGGVMEQTQLFPLIRAKVHALLNSYVQVPEIINDIESYIIPPVLVKHSGVLGSIALAELAYQRGA